MNYLLLFPFLWESFSVILYFFYFISFCDSLFCGSVSFSLYFFYFISFWLFPFLWEWFFFSLFLFSFSLYISLSLFCSLSLFILFYLGGSFVLVQVKQVRGVLRSFYYKNRGRGSLYNGDVIMKKKMK